jgi:hypothetical protein
MAAFIACSFGQINHSHGRSLALGKHIYVLTSGDILKGKPSMTYLERLPVAKIGCKEEN